MSISSAKRLISSKIYARTWEVHWSQTEFCELFDKNAISIDLYAFKLKFDQIKWRTQHWNESSSWINFSDAHFNKAR